MNKKVAHADEKGIAVTATYGELDAALDEFRRLLQRYFLLLKPGALDPDVVISMPRTDIFRTLPWKIAKRRRAGNVVEHRPFGLPAGPLLFAFPPEQPCLQIGCGTFLHPRHHVTVSIKGHTDRRVPEPLLHHLRVDALLEKQSGVAVPQIMKSDP